MATRESLESLRKEGTFLYQPSNPQHPLQKKVFARDVLPKWKALKELERKSDPNKYVLNLSNRRVTKGTGVAPNENHITYAMYLKDPNDLHIQEEIKASRKACMLITNGNHMAYLMRHIRQLSPVAMPKGSDVQLKPVMPMVAGKVLRQFELAKNNGQVLNYSSTTGKVTRVPPPQKQGPVKRYMFPSFIIIARPDLSKYRELLEICYPNNPGIGIALAAVKDAYAKQLSSVVIGSDQGKAGKAKGPRNAKRPPPQRTRLFPESEEDEEEEEEEQPPPPPPPPKRSKKPKQKQKGRTQPGSARGPSKKHTTRAVSNPPRGSPKPQSQTPHRTNDVLDSARPTVEFQIASPIPPIPQGGAKDLVPIGKGANNQPTKQKSIYQIWENNYASSSDDDGQLWDRNQTTRPRLTCQ